jgi:hypothetical protein
MNSLFPRVSSPTPAISAVSLPQSFANVTVLIEQISDIELRIRKAQVTPEDEVPFREETAIPLSDRDRDLFLSLLDNPPPTKDALKKAAAEHGRGRHQP